MAKLRVSKPNFPRASSHEFCHKNFSNTTVHLGHLADRLAGGLAYSQQPAPEDGVSASLLGVATQTETDGVLYPWQRVTQRWKKWALRRYRAWQKKVRQAQRSAQLARLALKGLVPIAWVVERLTQLPVEVPVRGLAGAVRPAGNAAGAADHQSLLSHARKSGSRDGGAGAGAQPPDVSRCRCTGWPIGWGRRC